MYNWVPEVVVKFTFYISYKIFYIPVTMIWSWVIYTPGSLVIQHNSTMLEDLLFLIFLLQKNCFSFVHSTCREKFNQSQTPPKDTINASLMLLTARILRATLHTQNHKHLQNGFERVDSHKYYIFLCYTQPNSAASEFLITHLCGLDSINGCRT